MKLRTASESVGWVNSVGPLTVSPQVPKRGTGETEPSRPKPIGNDTTRPLHSRAGHQDTTSHRIGKEAEVDATHTEEEAMTESELTKRLTTHWSKAGMVLFRNQVGTYQLRDGRWLSSGLCIGSSDLIGWTPVIVTQEMVGKPLAVFTAIEVKRPGRDTTAPARRERQERFIMKVRDAGGLAVIARDVVLEVETELKVLLGS